MGQARASGTVNTPASRCRPVLVPFVPVEAARRRQGGLHQSPQVQGEQRRHHGQQGRQGRLLELRPPAHGHARRPGRGDRQAGDPPAGAHDARRRRRGRLAHAGGGSLERQGLPHEQGQHRGCQVEQQASQEGPEQQPGQPLGRAGRLARGGGCTRGARPPPARRAAPPGRSSGRPWTAGSPSSRARGFSGSGLLTSRCFIGTWKTTPPGKVPAWGLPASNGSWASRKRSVLPGCSSTFRRRTSKSGVARPMSSTVLTLTSGTSASGFGRQGERRVQER